VTYPVTRRNAQLVRVLRLLKLLENGRRTVAQLADRLNVSQRTIYRDLEALDEAHIGWASSKGYGETPVYYREVA
jgi:predicted DNA-binding transcriptional regulator YafY